MPSLLADRHISLECNKSDEQRAEAETKGDKSNVNQMLQMLSICDLKKSLTMRQIFIFLFYLRIKKVK